MKGEAGAQDVRHPEAELKIPALEGRARLWRVVAALISLALAGLAYAYYSRGEPVAELYRTVPVARRDLVQVVEAAGRVDVQRRLDVPAPVAGRLLAVHVQQGDQVEAGQLLAELDQRALTFALRGAEAEAAAAAGGLAQARSRLQAAQRAVNRAKELLSQGLASREDVAAAESDLAQAQAALQAALGQKRAAGEQVASAKLSQTLTRIESPIDGVVLQAPERLGALASPEQGALFVIGKPLDTMRVDAQVSETEISALRLGAKAEVVVAALPGRTFEGRLEWIGIESERREGAVLYPIRLSVPNPEKQLLPGMTARVRIEVARAEDVLSAHEAALRFTPEDAEPAPPRSRVWKRVGPRELQSIPVRSGVSDGFHVQIEPLGEETVKEGDALVVGLMNPEGAKTPRVSLGAKK